MKRVRQLDGLRFIFCCVIIFSHFEFLEKSKYFSSIFLSLKNPTMAVDYFFMLSGFGIFLGNFVNKSVPTYNFSVKYALQKIRKIFPIYLFSLMLGMVYVFATLNHGNPFKRITGYLVLFIFDFSLLQSLVPNTNISHSINGVAWFLSCLYLSYMICPMFLKMANRVRSKKQAMISVIVVVITILVASEIAIYLENSNVSGIVNDLWYGHPFIRCWYLFLGMLAGYLYCNKSKEINGNICTAVILVAIIYYFVRGMLQINYCFIRLIDVSLCFSVLFFISISDNWIAKALSKDRIVRLGNDSMYFYLLHYPLRIVTDVLFERYCILKIGEIGYILEIVIILGTMVLLTIILKNKKTQIDRMFDGVWKRLLK